MKARNVMAFAGLLMIASATRASGQVVFDHLKCYTISDSGKTSYQADLNPEALPPFTTEPGCTIVLPAQLLCIDVEKTNVVPSPPPVQVDADTARDYLCYQVRCPPQAPPQFPLFVQDQFGQRSISVRGVRYLCAPAIPECGTSKAPVCGGFCANGVEVCQPAGQVCSCGPPPPAPCATIGASCGSCGTGTCQSQCSGAGLICATNTCANTCNNTGCPGGVCTEGTPANANCTLTGQGACPQPNNGYCEALCP